MKTQTKIQMAIPTRYVSMGVYVISHKTSLPGLSHVLAYLVISTIFTGRIVIAPS